MPLNVLSSDILRASSEPDICNRHLLQPGTLGSLSDECGVGCGGREEISREKEEVGLCLLSF